MSDDPFFEIVIARRELAKAVAAKEAIEPGAPGYREAVHQVGVAWGRVQRLEKQIQRRIGR